MKSSLCHYARRKLERIFTMNRLITLGVICVIIISGCQRANFTELTRSDKRVRYFKHFAAHELPIRPVYEINIQEAHEMMRAGYSYEKALYDETGKLISLSEILDGDVRRKVKYFYGSNELLTKFELTSPSNSDGGKLVEYFDELGKFVEMKRFDKAGNLIDEKELN